MSKSANCVWLVVVAAMWSGCSLGPLASYWVASPAALPAGQGRLDRAPAAGAASLTAPVTALALTDEEIGALRGEYAGRFELADQSAGEEIVVRHVYGERETVPWSQMAPAGKVFLIVGLAICIVLLVDVMSYDYTY